MAYEIQTIICCNVLLAECDKIAMLDQSGVIDSDCQQSPDDWGSCRCDRRRSFSQVLSYRRTKLNRRKIIRNTLERLASKIQIHTYYDTFLTFSSILKCVKCEMLDQSGVIDSDSQQSLDNWGSCRSDRHRSFFHVLNHRRTKMKRLETISTLHGWEKRLCGLLAQVFIQTRLFGQLLARFIYFVLNLLLIFSTDHALGRDEVFGFNITRKYNDVNFIATFKI